MLTLPCWQDSTKAIPLLVESCIRYINLHGQFKHSGSFNVKCVRQLIFFFSFFFFASYTVFFFKSRDIFYTFLQRINLIKNIVNLNVCFS